MRPKNIAPEIHKKRIASFDVGWHSFLKNPAALKAAAVNALENSSVHQVTAKLVKLMEIDGVGQCMSKDEAHTLQLKLAKQRKNRV